MTSVNIARLKAQLSRYVRAARGGQEIVITDHERPVAKLVPLAESAPFKLDIRSAAADPAALAKLRFRSKRHDVDSLAFLLEERNSKR
jgi:prevent-host-death family protein